MIIDPSAITFIQKVRPPHHVLRVQIQAGGCSGFEKQFSWCAHAEPDDVHIHDLIILDPVSAEMLSSATLKHVTELSQSGLVLEIPQSKSECGCGRSFDF